MIPQKDEEGGAEWYNTTKQYRETEENGTIPWGGRNRLFFSFVNAVINAITPEFVVQLGLASFMA